LALPRKRFRGYCRRAAAVSGDNIERFLGFPEDQIRLNDKKGKWGMLILRKAALNAGR
jgi:hypothetical protein